MNLAYGRVSTIEQNEQRQTQAFLNAGIEQRFIFIDKCSGKNTERPELQKCLNTLRTGDTLYITELSRLARSTKDLFELLSFFEQNGVNLKALDNSADTTTPQGRLFFGIMAVFAQFERELILERQRQGIELAKQKGLYKGRKKLTMPLENMLDELNVGFGIINKSQFCKKYNISRSSFYKYFGYDKSTKHYYFKTIF